MHTRQEHGSCLLDICLVLIASRFLKIVQHVHQAGAAGAKVPDQRHDQRFGHLVRLELLLDVYEQV